jgi:hypothetical protein
MHIVATLIEEYLQRTSPSIDAQTLKRFDDRQQFREGEDYPF